MLEDWLQPGTIYDNADACRGYVAAACERGHPVELAWVKKGVLSLAQEHSKLSEELLARVEGAIDLAVHQAITTLLYRAQRHEWDGDKCLALRQTIEVLVPAFAEYSREDFAYYLYGEELKLGTYWGDLVHDYDYERGSEGSPVHPPEVFYDSDDEVPPLDEDINNSKDEEDPSSSSLPLPRRTFRDCGRLEPDPLWVRARLSELGKLPFTRSTKSGLEKSLRIEWGTGIFRNSELHHPEHVFEDPQIAHDLSEANAILAALSAGRIEPEDAARACGELPTRFAIAQYRGIAYSTTTFNAVARRTSLEAIEVGVPVLCSAAFSAVGASPGDYYAGTLKRDKVEEVQEEALRLRKVLWAKRNSGPITIGETTYPNHALALHDFYTNHYDDFRAELGRYLKAQKTGEMPDQPPPIWRAFEDLRSDGIPFVSTGDIPQHALRYAYGSKYYPGQQDRRLRPRWRKCGKAEFPYAGKVYAALFTLEQYLAEDPHHIPSLNAKRVIHIRSDIVGELETSFAGLLPREAIVAEHVARYPSFSCAFEERTEQSRGWTKRDLLKYGLTKEEYEAFWLLITSAAPHGEASKQAKVSLGNWLIHFHEVRLVEIARRLAEQRGMILVYRDSDTGELTLRLREHLPRQDVQLVDFLRSGSVDHGNHNGVGNGLDVPPPMEPIQTERREPSTLQQNIQYELGRAYQRFDAELWRWLERSFVIHPTPTDGNAVFHALAGGLIRLGALKDAPDAHAEVRRVAVTYVCDRGIPPDGRRDDDAPRRLQAYYEDMVMPATHPSDQTKWGSDLEIEATACVFGVTIRVFSTLYVQVGFTSDVDRIRSCLAPLESHEEDSPEHHAYVMAMRGFTGYCEHFRIPLDEAGVGVGFLKLAGPTFCNAMGYEELCAVIADPRSGIDESHKALYQVAIPKKGPKQMQSAFFKAIKGNRSEYTGLGPKLSAAEENEEEQFRQYIIGQSSDFRAGKCFLDFAPAPGIHSEPSVFLYHTGGTHFFWLQPRERK